jgi:hypothetical protein
MLGVEQHATAARRLTLHRRMDAEELLRVVDAKTSLRAAT